MLYYNKYNRSNLINNIYSTLPFDQFVKWNFSRAWEIVDQYNILLQRCLSEAEQKYLWNLNIREYLRTELSKLLKEKEELDNKKKEVIEKINTINNIKDVKIKLKNEYEWNKIWAAIYKKFEEVVFTDEYFDCEELEEFIERLKKENPDNYKMWEDMIMRFFNSDNYQAIKKCWKIDKYALWMLNRERSQITKKLNRKDNDMSVEKRINDIKIGKTERNLQDQISDDVKEYFGKKSVSYNEEEDPRNIKTIYMETITSRIILNKNTDNKLRNELIKNHTDKIWLWNYIWNIYLDLIAKEREIRQALKIESDTEIDLHEEMVQSIIWEIKHWVDFCKDQYPMWLDAISQSDINYIEEKIRWDKNQSRNMEVNSDRKAREVFYTLRDYLEHNELEEKFEKIWNHNYRGIDIDINNMKKNLINLLRNMDSGDSDSIKENLSDYRVFWDIENKAFKHKDIQLELFS